MAGKRTSSTAFSAYASDSGSQLLNDKDLTGGFHSTKRACHEKVLYDFQTDESEELRAYVAECASKADPSAYCGWHATLARRQIDRYSERDSADADIIKVLLALKGPSTVREYTAARRIINETIRGPPSPTFSQTPRTPPHQLSSAFQDTPYRTPTASSRARSLSPSTHTPSVDSPTYSIGDNMHLTTLTDSPAAAYPRTPLGPAPSGVHWEAHIPSPPPLGSPLFHKGRNHVIRPVGDFVIWKDSSPPPSPSPAPAPMGLLPALPIDSPVYETASSPPYQAGDSPRWAPSSPIHSIWTDGGVQAPDMTQGDLSMSRSVTLVDPNVKQAKINYPGAGDGSALELKYWKARDEASLPLAADEPTLPSFPYIEGSVPMSRSTTLVDAAANPPDYIHYQPGAATWSNLQLKYWKRRDQPSTATARDGHHASSSSFHLEDSVSTSSSTSSDE